MNKIFARISVLSLAAIVSFANAVIADAVPAAKDAKLGGYTAINLYAYDTEGKFGLVYAANGSLYRPDLFSSTWGFEDGTGGHAIGFLEPQGLIFQTGVPYWWELTSPWSGTVRGWSRTVSSYAGADNFMIPLPGSQVGGFQFIQTSEPQGWFFVSFNLSIVDDFKRVSPLAFNSLGNSEVEGDVVAIYLPENILYPTIKNESHHFNMGDIDLHSNGVAIWGDYTSGLGTPYAEFSKTVPAGPLLIVVDLEGAGFQTLRVEGIDRKGYYVNMPFVPSEGSAIPTATEIVASQTPPEWILRGALDRTLTSDVKLSTDLQFHCDTNGDGILDAADYSLITSKK